ncbi:MAG: hypothetical protein RIQ47_1987 [Bacteroidota bacterium]|jgi:hypothetical protein
MNVKKKIFLIVGLAAFLTACVKEDDLNFDNLSLSEWTPDIAAPLVNSSFSFEDITGWDVADELEVDASGRITIISQSSLYDRQATDFFTIQDQSVTAEAQLTPALLLALQSAPSVSVPVVQPIAFTTTNNCRIDSVLLKSGVLSLQAVNTSSISGRVIIFINQLKKNGRPFVDTLFLPASGTSNTSVNLNDYQIGLSQTGAQNQLEIAYGMTFFAGGSSPQSGTGITVDAAFQSLVFKNAYGYFGNLQFDIPTDSAALDLFSYNSTDSFYFADPVMKLSVANSMGANFRLSGIRLQPIGQQGQLIPFSTSLQTFDISAPAIPGSTASDTLVFNNANCNGTFSTALAQRPQYIEYSGTVTANVPAVSTSNFIRDDSRFQANLRVELPLDGWSQRFSVFDTADFFIANLDEVDSLVFRLNITNGFPFDAYTQVYFVDANFQVLDSLLLNPSDIVIASAAIDANGYATVPAKRMHDEPMSSDRIRRIISCEKLIVSSVLRTANAPARSVKFTNRNQLDVKIGVRARLAVAVN